ncbi:MAG TPA: hypothetical protein VFX86_02130 [Candidatus Saccharimonadales bacterium]|nr:hypothetical protein [Candidatus Saccharimonadales bacterium]
MYIGKGQKGFALPDILLLLIIICAVIFAGYYVMGADKDKVADKNNSSSTGSKSQPGVKDLGEPFIQNGVTYTVYKFDTDPKYEGDAPDKGTKYVAVFIRAKSNSKSAYHPHEFLLKLRKDKYVDQATAFGTGIYTGKPLLGRQVVLTDTELAPLNAVFIKPAEKLDGYLLYQIASDYKGSPSAVITDGNQRVTQTFKLQ